MNIIMMAAVAKNGVIGNGSDIPWSAKGEQTIFKAMTYNQWLIVGRKTFETIKDLPNRKFIVVSRSMAPNSNIENGTIVVTSIQEAIEFAESVTDTVIVSGGGEIYQQFIDKASTLYLSVIDCEPKGDVHFPDYSNHGFSMIHEQKFESTINYTFKILNKVV